jgi:hypothetical protein
MLDQDRVFNLFIAFSDLPEETAGRFRPVCQAAADSLCAKLSRRVRLPRDMERLCLAAAAIAYHDFCGIGSSGLAGEIRVGEISLRHPDWSGSPPSRMAAELRDRFLLDIADILKTPFVFGRVTA